MKNKKKTPKKPSALIALSAAMALSCLPLGACAASATAPPFYEEESVSPSTPVESVTPPTEPPVTEPTEPSQPEPPVTEPTEPVEPTVPTEPETPPEENKSVLIRSRADSLSVRSGKGTSYRRIGYMDKGDMLSFTALEDGWYKVRYYTGYGYVSAVYVSEYAFEKSADRIEKVIGEGEKLLGTPYVYGAQRYHFGDGVKNGNFDVRKFDCSSLMQYIFKIGANVNLGTTSRSQSLQGSTVAKKNIARGDLLFFTNASRKDNVGLERIGHVALYLGDNHILHTASDYAVIEEISPLRWSYFITARRII